MKNTPLTNHLTNISKCNLEFTQEIINILNFLENSVESIEQGGLESSLKIEHILKKLESCELMLSDKYSKMQDLSDLRLSECKNQLSCFQKTILDKIDLIEKSLLDKENTISTKCNQAVENIKSQILNETNCLVPKIKKELNDFWTDHLNSERSNIISAIQSAIDEKTNSYVLSSDLDKKINTLDAKLQSMISMTQSRCTEDAQRIKLTIDSQIKDLTSLVQSKMQEFNTNSKEFIKFSSLNSELDKLRNELISHISNYHNNSSKKVKDEISSEMIFLKELIAQNNSIISNLSEKIAKLECENSSIKNSLKAMDKTDIGTIVKSFDSIGNEMQNLKKSFALLQQAQTSISSKSTGECIALIKKTQDLEIKTCGSKKS